ncbi:Wzz/FepE/Etk N-terminal domain-containing protein [Limnochorda pilosa]|uniref:Capsular polysaccharide biosynthesis protein n=1 Tax=Limnochorda pilosa TaxID=1555112 RepID=A0A0K2SLK1_LIMPI|nr:Wzz/FepE/Etk N-terminal domain-containing protein [Limnochorda pilosa]BAS27887.1 capsular polysaccharide biosynthesis protein [Limnochorda pilosa]
MAQEAPLPTSYDDEIDLRALVEVLLRRRSLILGLVAVAVATAAALSYFVLPPVYESEVRLFLPRIDEDLSMTPEQYARFAVSEPVLEPVRTSLAPNVPIQAFAKRFSVKLDGGATVLEVRASAPTAEESRRLTARWLDAFTAGVRERVERRLNQALAEAEANVASMRAGLEAVGDALALETGQRDLALEIASAAAYGQEYGTALRERGRLLEIQANLPSRLRPEMLLSPALPTAPSSPRKLLNLTVAAVLAGMIGVFLAFGIEWWKGSAPGPSPTQ